MKSTGHASRNRKNHRKISQRLQIIDQKKYQQRIHYHEEGCDDETVVTEHYIGSMEIASVQRRLIDTGECGKDSGLVEEDGPEFQQPILNQ